MAMGSSGTQGRENSGQSLVARSQVTREGDRWCWHGGAPGGWEGTGGRRGGRGLDAQCWWAQASRGGVCVEGGVRVRARAPAPFSINLPSNRGAISAAAGLGYSCQACWLHTRP